MAFEFTETFDVLVPNVEEQLANFAESEFSETHGLIIEIAAIHEGTTANYNHYTAKGLERSLNSWLHPYPKPIIMNHDLSSEPIGRVIGAKMDYEADGTPYIKLQAAITDPEAVRKVMDKRYLTGSVGGKAEEAICSICNTDWAAPRESRGLPCGHRRGQAYKGQIATLRMEDIDFKEYSIVNAPSDSRSAITASGTAVSESDDWVKPTRFFVLDLANESIVEFTESEEIDLLGEMKKKEASPKYREMKGAFLEAQIVNKIEEDGVKRHLNDTKDAEGIVESDSEENQMATEGTTEVENEDILAVAEQLSEDLSTTETEEVTEETEEVSEEAENTDTTENSEGTEEVEEGERPQGQEKDHGRDIDPENSDGAPKSREDEDTSDDTVAAEEEDGSEDVAETEEGEEAEAAAESELNETDEVTEEAQETETEVEPEESDTNAELEALKEENSRLKKALHRVLAERVVEAKISVGMIAAESRNEEVALHAERSATSLADSLRDLANMPKKAAVFGKVAELEMDQDSQIVEDENNVTTIGEEEGSTVDNVDPEERAISELTNALMGRRKNQL